MAKRSEKFGADVAPADKKKINKEGLKKAISIFKFTAPYKGTFAIGFIFLILSQITSMSIPLLMGQMVSSILSPSEQSTNPMANMSQMSPIGQQMQGSIMGLPKLSLDQMTLLFLVILAAQALFSFFRVYTFSRVSEKSMRDVRKTLYSKMISLPTTFFEKNRVGELMSRITSDVTQLQDVLSITLAEFFRQIFTLIGGICLIIYFSGKLTLFMLSTFPFLVVAAFFFGKFIRKNSKKVQEELAQTNVIVEETLQSVNVVKAFTNETLEVKRYTTSLEKVLSWALKTATYRGSFISFIIFVLFGAIVGVVWYGGHLVQNHELSFDKLLTFIIYTGFIGGSVGGLGDMYAQIQKTIGASERILEILGEESEVEITDHTKSVDLKGEITYKNVAFAYPSRKDMEVLKNISFEVKAGEKIALVGYSGGGKSTIVSLLMRYYKLSGGQILVDGKDITDYDITALRQNIAIVPQEVMLFGGTIKENIAYGNPNASDTEIREAARKANALDFIESFPEQLETIVGERGVKLSGGQRQRIAIARAILKDPAILILDEATSALDSESEKLVQDALDALMQNRTTIIIAHRLATIRNVDTIYVLKEGEIAESGKHENLLLVEDGIYANLVKLQYETSLISE
ncbi:ABC transporter ATP-binding protein [Flectobacillus major]|uniref:ABC transporter ATP-binding protein n=1 Tax=Flectobacillus major TaxID=103 RepID=UPI00041C2D66|nr:ABC transporter transmembrane domain-containing protein [Flectobacillus major]